MKATTLKGYVQAAIRMYHHRRHGRNKSEVAIMVIKSYSFHFPFCFVMYECISSLWPSKSTSPLFMLPMNDRCIHTLIRKYIQTYIHSYMTKQNGKSNKYDYHYGDLRFVVMMTTTMIHSNCCLNVSLESCCLHFFFLNVSLHCGLQSLLHRYSCYL